LAQNKSRRLLWAVCLAALAAFAAAMVWLHYQQLCSPGGGSDPYTSDLGMHLAFAQRGMVYSTVSLLIGPAYALGGRIGIAVLPQRMVLGPLERGLVIPVQVEGLRFCRRFYIVYHKDKFLSPLAKDFLELCRNYEMDYPMPQYNGLF
jgi:DNA-binding transcriptional LysR family regulator